MKRRAAVGTVVVAALAAVTPLPRAIVERWYSQAVFPALQHTITPASNAVPISCLDLLLLSATAAFAVLLYRRVATDGWGRGIARAAGIGLAWAAAAYLVFLATWGLNYRRVPLAEKMTFEPRRITRDAARALGDVNASTLNRLYAAAHRGPLSLDAVGASFIEAVRQLGTRPPVLARPKETLLGGYFHQITVAGMTDPFFLETLVAPDLLDVERPFVVAHEWAHLAGYADESEANFVAWLACRHGDALAQYSGALEMIGYAGPSRPLRDALDVGPRIDLRAIQDRYRQTHELVRAAARRGYDTYLKANRVEKGVDSYDAVVQLILGTALNDEGYPKRR